MEKMEAIHNMIKEGMFKGIEVEGKHKGCRTLFISTQYNLDIIKNELQNDVYNQIYFGTGFQSEILDWDIIRYFSNQWRQVTVEVLIDSYNKIPKDIIENNKIHKVITFKHICDFKNSSNITVKFEENSGIYCFSSLIYNNCNVYNNKEVK